MKTKVAQYRKVLSETPIDDLEVSEVPRVMFTPDGTTWVKVTVRFVVEPKQSVEIQKKLLLEILGALRDAPEKVRFPSGDAR
jgi:hypothetical protein